MQPINYMANLQPVNILGSLQTGLEFGQDIKAQQEAESKAEQYKTDLQDFMANPTYQKAMDMQLKHPEQGKAITDYYNGMDAPRKQAETQFLGQLHTSLISGNPDVTIKILNEKKQAMENSGQDTKTLDMAINMAKNNPQGLIGWTTMMLNTTMGAEETQKLTDTYMKIDKAPLEKQKIQQDIASKQVDDDIKKDEIKLKVIQTQLNKEGMGIRRDELSLKEKDLIAKIEENETKKAQLENQKQADAASAYGTIDNMLNTTDRLLKNKSLNNVVGSIQGQISPKFMGDEENDAVALIDTLSSQAFLSQVSSMKGMGALSDAEGKKLSAGLQSFSRTQSESQFRANLKEVQRLMLKARKNIQTKYGVKQSVPDTPAAMPSDTEINDLLKKYGQ